MCEPSFDSGKKKLFLFSERPRIVLGHYEPHIQRTPESLSSGTGRPGVKITAHLHQAPRSRLSAPIRLLSCTSSWSAEGQLYIDVYLPKGTVGLIHTNCLTTGSEDFKQHNKREGLFRFAELLFLFHTGICGRTCAPQVQRLHAMQHVHVCVHWYHDNLKPRCLRRLAHGVSASRSAISNNYNLIIFHARVTNLVRETISNGGS